MRNYLDLLKLVYTQGIDKPDRTGVGIRSIFGQQLRFDLQQGFPLVTTKKCHLKSIIHELLWFLQGSTNIKYLREHGVRIWDEWADAEGNLGPVYGKQWRSWPITVGSAANQPTSDIICSDANQTTNATTDVASICIDQIAQVIAEIKANPYSRRLLVSAWNVGQLAEMALPPCHLLFQFYVNPVAKTLSCQLYQRSADIFLGVPFNIASYSLLLMMVAQVCDLQPGEFVHTFGDVHLYHNHFEQAELQLSREPYPLPTMVLNPERKHIDDFVYEDFQLLNYQAHPAIKAPVAV